MIRPRSVACVLLCVGALGAGCASDSREESPSVANEPPAATADRSTSSDASRPPDQTAPASEIAAPTSSAPTEEIAAGEDPSTPKELSAREDPSTPEELSAREEPSTPEELSTREEPSAVDAPVSAPDRAELQAEASVFPPLDTGGGVANWTVEIVESVPHNPEAFTQGLELAGGTMYESTGLRGRSSLRTVDAGTGEVMARVDLPEEFFGEGITVVGDEIVQLTWQSGTALVYDRLTLEEVGEHRYEGEGWGLCLSEDVLIMSNGSDRLARRDPQTFELLGTVTVTASGYDGRLDYLNELECVEGMVIANVWQTEQLLVIDPESGRVVAAIDAGALVDDVRQNSAASDIDVLNGVAFDESTGTLWMTGKLWPRLYRVRVVEVP